MLRRSFLKKAVGATAAAATLPFSVPAIAQSRHEWKMVLSWPKLLPGLGTGAMRIAKRITAMTAGELTITVYGGGELVPPLGVFDAVSQGTAEMGHSAAYYWLNKNKASAFFCGVPGGLTAQEQNGWLYFGGGLALWNELYAEFGLRAFPAGNTGTQMGGWFNKELHTVEDLQGLKMRIPGLAGEVFTKLGGSAQNIPSQELYTAMQSGVIDALEWVGPWNDMALGFHKVSKYYYGPAFQEGGPTLELMVNQEAYNALPKHLQQAIKIACAAENDIMLAEFFANNLRSFKLLQKDSNIQIKSYPEPILEAFFMTASEVVASAANESAIGKRIYRSYHAFKEAAKSMSPYSEYGYLRARQKS